MSRRYDPRRVKGHETYTAPELARAAKVKISTVRRWKKLGLAPIDDHRPHLFLGHTVRDFWAGRKASRIELKPGELFCVACRGPRLPRDGLIWIEPYSATSINFVGICPTSGHRMRRGVRIGEITDKMGLCRIAHEDGSSTVVRGGDPPQRSLFEEVLT